MPDPGLGAGSILQCSKFVSDPYRALR